MSNPYRTADTPETIPAQNSSKFPLDIEASETIDVAPSTEAICCVVRTFQW